MDATRKNNLACCLAVFAIAVGLRLIVLAWSDVYPISNPIEQRGFIPGTDSLEYVRYARNIALYGTFCVPSTTTSLYGMKAEG